MKNIIFRKLNFFLLLLICTTLLAACGKEVLYQDLSEQDANEILVVLFQQGINAQKIKTEVSQEVSYSVSVPQDQIHEARRILVENNLPRVKEIGSEGICKEKGLIPTPEEEKCRKLLAKKGDIINSLQRVPGVIDADIVLNIPDINPFSTDTQSNLRPTASAVIRVKKSQDSYEVTEARMQQFISKAVENLDPRDVSVIISFVQTPQELLSQGPKEPPVVSEPGEISWTTIAGLVISAESVKRFKIFAVLMLVLLLAVSAALIVNVIKLTKMRQTLKLSKLSAGLSDLQGSSTPLLPAGAAPAQAPSIAEESATPKT